MEERRREARIREKAVVSVKIQSAPDARELEGKSLLFDVQDISPDGLQLSVDAHVPVGALLEFKISLGDSTTKFWHTGCVVWNDNSSKRVGVQFDNQANPQFSSWQEALNKLLQRQRAGKAAR